MDTCQGGQCGFVDVCWVDERRTAEFRMDECFGTDVHSLHKLPAQGFLVDGDHGHIILQLPGGAVHLVVPHHGVGLPLVLLVLVVVKTPDMDGVSDLPEAQGRPTFPKPIPVAPTAHSLRRGS